MAKAKTKAVATVSGSPMVPVKCREHKTYNAIAAPRKTKKHPEGCVVCWEYYTALRAVKEDYEHLYLKAQGERGVGQPRAFESPQVLAEAGLSYLEWCIKNEKHPTKTGFAVFCGVCLDTVRAYRVGEYDVDKDGMEHNPPYSIVVKKLDGCFIAKQEQRLLDARAAATNLIAWMNNNAGWAQNERRQIELGIEIRTIDYSGGTTFAKEVKEIKDIAGARAGTPPDADVIDVEAVEIKGD